MGKTIGRVRVLVGRLLKRYLITCYKSLLKAGTFKRQAFCPSSGGGGVWLGIVPGAGGTIKHKAIGGITCEEGIISRDQGCEEKDETDERRCISCSSGLVC